MVSTHQFNAEDALLKYISTIKSICSLETCSSTLQAMDEDILSFVPGNLCNLLRITPQ
jgi:hypothetical protein